MLIIGNMLQSSASAHFKPPVQRGVHDIKIYRQKHLRTKMQRRYYSLQKKSVLCVSMQLETNKGECPVTDTIQQFSTEPFMTILIIIIIMWDKMATRHVKALEG